MKIGLQIPAFTTPLGPARLAAFDNGSVTDHTSFASPIRTMLGGKAVAFLRGTAGRGMVTVTATAAGLRPARITMR